jgi:hypothetical protein
LSYKEDGYSQPYDLEESLNDEEEVTNKLKESA